MNVVGSESGIAELDVITTSDNVSRGIGVINGSLNIINGYLTVDTRGGGTGISAMDITVKSSTLIADCKMGTGIRFGDSFTIKSGDVKATGNGRGRCHYH